MPLPNPNFFASVPLQYVFRDKDTGEPLSAGVVSFFSDPEFTVPKDVYQLSLGVDNSVVFTNIGNVLILSSIGTFVDDSGSNLVPYYYPWTNPPEETDPGAEQLYFVTVYSSDGVLQFTLQEWPPNVGGGGSGTSGSVLSFNQITNPQFSVVNFTEDPATSVYTYATSGTMSVEIAPGWTINTVGTGTISVSQQSLTDDIVSEPPYALRITSVNGGSLSSVELVQRITNSPRILASPETAGLSAISGFLVASSAVSSSVAIEMRYIPSDTSASEVQLFSGNTETDGSFSVFQGTAQIDTPISTDNASGYVDVVINIGIGSTVNISSVQLVQVENTDTLPGFEQQSTQEQLNGMMWYYQPQLIYKPIPSYLLGWDFAMNPCQELGTTVAASSAVGANGSRYVADQTIAFQSVTNSISFVFDSAGMNVSTAANTQFAIIQYLGPTEAIELLRNNTISVKLNGSVSATTLVGYVNLYWTQNASVPTITSPDYDSLVTTLTLGIPTVASGWTKIGRSDLGEAVFQLTTGPQDISFTGWNAQNVSGIDTATYFAAVISFKEMSTTQVMTLRYATLASGFIATDPPPLNAAQTLQGLQYYYETSYDVGPASGASTSTAIAKPMIGMNPGGGGGTSSYAQTFNQSYTYKRADPDVTFISEVAGTSNAITMTTYQAGASAANADATAPTDGTGTIWTAYISQTSILMASISATAFAHTGSNSVPFYSVGTYNYIADARFGVV